MFLLVLGTVTFVMGLGLFLYGTVAPIESKVDEWFYKRRAKSIDKKVNGK